MFTRKQIINEIGEKRLALWREPAGYYCFGYDDARPFGEYHTRSVMVYRLNHMKFASWVQEGRDFLQAIRDGRAKA